MTLVESRNLRLGYGTRMTPPCPDFSVGAGDFVAITGANGTGKTTLVKAVAGLLRPLGGSLALDACLANGGIGYVPQQKSIQQDFPASVREIVQSGCRALRGWRPLYTRKERRMAEEAMARFGVASLAKRNFRELSGGQRQRVFIARALAMPRRLLLLDEPTTGLDPAATAELYKLLGDVNSRGIAVMMVTHDLEPARPLASHVLALGDKPSFGLTV